MLVKIAIDTKAESHELTSQCQLLTEANENLKAHHLGDRHRVGRVQCENGCPSPDSC